MLRAAVVCRGKLFQYARPFHSGFIFADGNGGFDSIYTLLEHTFVIFGLVLIESMSMYLPLQAIIKNIRKVRRMHCSILRKKERQSTLAMATRCVRAELCLKSCGAVVACCCLWRNSGGLVGGFYILVSRMGYTLISKCATAIRALCTHPYYLWLSGSNSNSSGITTSVQH